MPTPVTVVRFRCDTCDSLYDTMEAALGCEGSALGAVARQAKLDDLYCRKPITEGGRSDWQCLRPKGHSGSCGRYEDR